MDDREEQGHGGSLHNSENLISESPPDPPSTCMEPSFNPPAENDDESTASFNQREILRAIQVVERDSLAIAESFTSLFASLRLALSEVTSSSVDHMQCFSDATGRLQESVLDAATKGSRYINSCYRLNEEMKNIDGLASQLKFLRRNVDVLDSAVNKLLHSP
ncbi:uncharacterized protein G2W53_015506 [Senna tora]|uniref:BLOC-1-related complex subunit 6 C-terminal helix domain-containing protein n=1 Tax=Senna tora TaxID=362788 RepID=A0A834WWD1_9FABA|nr:uncharacterized protein G2W53_015506 [Senna tora]